MEHYNDESTLPDGRVVLCGANAYEQKFYINEAFDKLPLEVKKELKIISVLFTQEAGGIFLMVFDEEGGLEFETMSEEDDITYDEVSARLLVSKIKINKAQLLEQLTLFYKIYFMDID